MPLSRKPNSHKASRKWKRCGKIIKHLLLAEGGSNKKPIIKLEDVVNEYLKNTYNKEED
jgi:hypothetical protein